MLKFASRSGFAPDSLLFSGSIVGSSPISCCLKGSGVGSFSTYELCISNGFGARVISVIVKWIEFT